MASMISAGGAVALLLAFSPLWISQASADDGEDSVFCAWAQQQIAGTGLVADVITHTVYEDFVSSHPGDSPLTVQQYWSNPVPGPSGMSRVVSCKMLTAERINQALGESGTGGAPPAAGDQSCELINSQILANLLSRIPRDQLAVPLDLLRVDKEQMAYVAPMWLESWPFEPLSRDDEGVLHIHSRALFVPYSAQISGSDRLNGGYYCHLIAPDYLEAVLRGKALPEA